MGSSGIMFFKGSYEGHGFLRGHRFYGVMVFKGSWFLRAKR